MKIKKHNFEKWYATVTNELVDTRYPVKGMVVWKPYGYKILKKLINLTSNGFDRYGHDETYFPMLIPMSLFKKERDFLHGFQGESYIVTHAGDKKLNEKLIVRPTSETVMYEMFHLWVQGVKDLPIKIYQTVNIFRYETKMTKPMLRIREIIKFQEGHTAHATAEEADKHVKQMIQMYNEIFNELGFAYKILKTPQWDTFAGALYNYDFVTVMPDGKCIELCSVINLGNKFAKAFDITFMDSKGVKRPVHQTCYGHSERVLGAVIAVHGDEYGMILPLSIVPWHAVIVPIKEDKKVKKIVEKIEKKLINLGISTTIDRADQRIGEKSYRLEKLGIPLRIEIGPNEVEKKQVIIIRRDTKAKTSITLTNFDKQVMKILKSYKINIKHKAEKEFNKNIKTVDTIAKLREMYKNNKGMVGLPWCGNDACGHKIEEESEIPTLGYETINQNKKCALCGKKARYIMYYGRTY